MAQFWLSLIYQCRWKPVLCLWLIALAVALVGIFRVTIQTDISAYFDPNDPQTNAFYQAQKDFKLDPSLIILLEKNSPWPGSNEERQLLRLVEQLHTINGIKGIAGYPQTLTQTPLSQLPRKQRALLINDAQTAIIMQLTVDPQTLADKPRLANTLEGVSHQLAMFADKQLVDYFISGELALNWQYAQIIRQDLKRFALGLALLLSVLLLFVIRHRIWLLAMAGCALFSLISALGVAGWLGLSLAAISAFVPVVIVILSLAYTAHLYFSWRLVLRRERCAYEAMKSSLSSNLSPLFWGGITTIFGFVILAFSPSPPISSFGVLVAFAIAFNFIASYALLGVGLCHYYRSRQPYAAELVWAEQPLARLVRGCQRWRRPLLTTTFLITGLSLTFCWQLKFDDDPLGYFPEDNPFTQGTQRIEQTFYGVNQLHLVVTSEANDSSWYDTDYRQQLAAIQGYFEQRDDVTFVSSLLDYRASASQALMVAMQSNQRLFERAERASILNQAKKSTLISVYLTPTTSAQLLEFERQWLHWLSQQAFVHDTSPLLGRTLLFAQLSQHNAQRMLQAFVLALVLAFSTICLLRRDVYLASIAIIANVVPLLWAFAIWQIIGGHMSLGAAVVMGMIFGIVVDDSFHVILKTSPYRYLHQRRRRMMGIASAISLTSLALVVGFALGLLSDFAPIAELGLLSAMVIFFAWLFDLWLLPLILPKQKVQAITEAPRESI
ncbi:efflux RND transporter permease subunit [Paraferrimonas haliotis]|uniref:RND transporter n=1 Tax=Paraferrimonas haliotis TaxID=2013866 RepID=A0AA37WZQ5_9GAMM|nr:MMPL family transporter [Paraferrimonas haliotis]GLS84036.1 RND transporter [Paraferrimonas haliotis]